MALPALVNSNLILGSDVPSTIAVQWQALAGALVDIFGLPNNTNVTNALFSVAAGGLQYPTFQNVAGSPGAVGRLQRNATNLEFHDGTAARILYRQSGTDVAVADGGTALSTAPSNGQVLIGNGTGYTLATFTAGTAMDAFTNGAGSITVNRTVASVGKATITADISTSNTSFEDAAGLTVTITPGIRRVLLILMANLYNGGVSTGQYAPVRFLIDGAAEAEFVGEVTEVLTKWRGTQVIRWLTEAQTSGSHTYKVQWRVLGGTASIFASAGSPAMFAAIPVI